MPPNTLTSTLAGYLPERASKRARKIVLRTPMGLQWMLGAAVFGVVVLIAGLAWVNAGGPPERPYVATVPVEAGAGATVTRVEAIDGWVVTGVGPVLAVAGQLDDLAWCETSARLQSTDGGVWTATGRGLGAASLATHPVAVHDGTVYVDPTTVVDGSRPSVTAPTPAC